MPHISAVMAGPAEGRAPAIHVLRPTQKDVDGRDEHGHDASAEHVCDNLANPAWRPPGNKGYTSTHRSSILSRCFTTSGFSDCSTKQPFCAGAKSRRLSASEASASMSTSSVKATGALS